MISFHDNILRLKANSFVYLPYYDSLALWYIACGVLSDLQPSELSQHGTICTPFDEIHAITAASHIEGLLCFSCSMSGDKRVIFPCAWSRNMEGVP
jgi:hypothetical protein